MYRRNMSGKLKKFVMFVMFVIRLSILLLLSRPFERCLKIHSSSWVTMSHRLLNKSESLILSPLSCWCFPVPVASFVWLHRFIFTVWTIFNGWKISRQYRNQQKPNPIYTFSCVVSRLLLFAMSSEWLIGCMVNWKTFFSILAGAPDLGKSKFEKNISGTQKNLSTVRRIF